ncbi:MAG: hypothetical protein V4576_03245 [Patescibacteria group bacterium]
MKEGFTPKEISEEELTAIERLFRDGVDRLGIDIDEYRKICEADEDAKELFEDMVDKCLDYTVDVSNMERHAREQPHSDIEDSEAISNKRKITHNATVDRINIFARYFSKKFGKRSFVTWDGNDRFRYGIFAINLTLNLFKNKILVDLIKEKNASAEIDTSSLRESATAQELLVLDYVDILCIAEKEDRPLLDEEKSKLSQIEAELNQTADKILGAFHQIYIRRY